MHTGQAKLESLKVLPKSIAVVTPLYNEQENVEKLFQHFHKLASGTPFTWTLIFVDDGKRHQRRYTRKQLINLCELWRPRHVTYFNILLFFPIAALGLLRRIFKQDISAPIHSDAQPCPTAINSLLKTVFALEKYCLPQWGMPFGVSILAIFVRAI